MCLLCRIFKTWIRSKYMNVTIRHFFVSQNLFYIQYARYNEKKNLNENMEFQSFKILLKGLASFKLYILMPNICSNLSLNLYIRKDEAQNMGGAERGRGGIHTQNITDFNVCKPKISL